MSPPPPNSAQFVSQSVPQTMTAGQTYAVWVRMKNIGSNTWTSQGAYSLGSQNAQDNTTWGMGRVALPSSVASGSEVTFNFTVTAPSTTGSYNFQWRMVQDGVEWFGAFSPNVSITVNSQSGGNTGTDPDPSTPYADVRWIVADQLGTPRMIVDQSGSLANVSRHDYLPFGEELTGQIGGRTTQQGYTGDNTRQKFTQKERDVETGLDYFGARYFSNVQGRFTSPDKPFADQDIVEPQSWNLYSYVRNNPLKYVDDFGDSITYASPELEAISNAIRAQSPTYNEALKGFEGEGAPDLTIGYGDAGLDANGVDKATGVTKTSIRPEETLDDCSECPAKPMTHPVLPAKLKSATIIIDNSLKGDKSKTEDVLEHETGHGNHARKQPKTYSDNSAETTRTKGATPHDKRPNEIEANRFRDQVKAERKEYEKKRKEEEKQRKQQEKERKKHPDDFQ